LHIKASFREKNPDPTFKEWTCLALGPYFKHWSERVRRIRDDPESAKAWEAMIREVAGDKEYFSRFVGRDPDVLMTEAEAAFERTIKEFGDTSRRGDSLNKDAQAEPGWPTLYILDHRGVIRHKFLDSPGNGKLDSAIDALVQEAEREAARSKKD
jgi:hypothetical protein